MSLIQGTSTAMQSAYLPTGRATGSSRAEDGAARGSKTLLQAVWWISREWVERVAVTDPHRVTFIDLGLLIDDLVRAGDYSSAAMTDVEALLCSGCRHLDAVQGQCTGQSLHQCLLLRESSH